MSTRSLAFVAVALFLLGAGAVLAGASRLGHMGSSKPVELVFENPMLKARKGQLVLLRPLVTNLPWMRVQSTLFPTTARRPPARPCGWARP